MYDVYRTMVCMQVALWFPDSKGSDNSKSSNVSPEQEQGAQVAVYRSEMFGPMK